MSAGEQNPPSKNSFFFSSNSTHTYAKCSFKHKMAELKQGFLNSLFPFPPSFFDYQSTKTSPKSNVKNCACLENNFFDSLGEERKTIRLPATFAPFHHFQI